MKTVVLRIDKLSIFFQEKNQLKLCLGDNALGNIVSQTTSKIDYEFRTKNKEIRAGIEDSELNLFNCLTLTKRASCSVSVTKRETRCPF